MIKSNKPITHAFIIPLIGGQAIGQANAFGSKPEYMISYSPFAKNDEHIKNYWRDVPFFNIDQDEDFKPNYVDVVGSTCPCAGLSSLSPIKNDDHNNWMYESTKYVLENIEPKVYWGENAPALFTEKGQHVANRLHKIGKEYNYNMLLYQTAARLHGSPQMRRRSFFFFFKDEGGIPVLDYFKRSLITPIEEILSRPTIKDDPMNVLINKNDPMMDPWMTYFFHRSGYKNFTEAHNNLTSSIDLIDYAYKIDNGSFKPIIKFMENNHPNHREIKSTYNKQKKIDDNKGFWGHGITIPKNTIGAFVSSMPYTIVNGFNEFADRPRFINLRESLRIMNMPDDFILTGNNPVTNVNHICQNVSPMVSEDVAKMIKEYLYGKFSDKMIKSSDIVKISNIKDAIYTSNQLNTTTVDSFYD